MNHLLRKHPELAKVNTVFKSIKDTTKGFTEDFNFWIDTNEAILCPPQMKETKQVVQVKKYYGIFLKDTLTKIQDGITVKLFQNGNEIGVIVIRPDSVRDKKVPVQVVAVDQNPCPCPHKATWYDHASYWGFAICFIFDVIMIAGLFLVKLPK